MTPVQPPTSTPSPPSVPSSTPSRSLPPIAPASPPAPSLASSELARRRATRERERRTFAYKMVASVLMLMIFIFGVGLAMLSFNLRPDTGLFLMALPPLAPLVWYAYGYLFVPEREADWGLILSAVGWALTAIALLIQASNWRTAIETAAPTSTIADALRSAGVAPLAQGCGLLSIGCLLAGLALSWHASQTSRS